MSIEDIRKRYENMNSTPDIHVMEIGVLLQLLDTANAKVDKLRAALAEIENNVITEGEAGWRDACLEKIKIAYEALEEKQDTEWGKLADATLAKSIKEAPTEVHYIPQPPQEERECEHKMRECNKDRCRCANCKIFIDCIHHKEGEADHCDKCMWEESILATQQGATIDREKNKLRKIVCDNCDDTGITGYCEFGPYHCKRCEKGEFIRKLLVEINEEVEREFKEKPWYKKIL